MADPTPKFDQNRPVLIDHREIKVEMNLYFNQMIVNGVLMQERKDLTKTLNLETGVEEEHFSHRRVMDERSVTTKQSIIDGEEKEEMIETDMADMSQHGINTLENFNIEWKEKCPWYFEAIRVEEPEILARFFTSMNPFA